MISENEILTRIATAMDSLEMDFYCTSEYEPFPPHFPCVYARMTDKYPLQRYMDLSYTENQNRVVFTAEVFAEKAHGGKGTAEEIQRNPVVIEAYLGSQHNREQAEEEAGAK